MIKFQLLIFQVQMGEISEHVETASIAQKKDLENLWFCQNLTRQHKLYTYFKKTGP